MVRVFYVNVEVFFELRIDECFEYVLKFCKEVIEMNLNNFFLFDIMGCIYLVKMRILFGFICKDNCVIEISVVILVFLFLMKWFKKL